jgi:hypothetical protein
MSRPFSLRYVSASGQVVNLDTWPYFWNETDLQNYSWSFESVNNPIGYGARFTKITRTAAEKTINLLVWNDGNDITALTNSLTSVFDADVISETPGRLYLNDAYIIGYFTSVSHSRRRDKNYVELELTFATSYPFWTSEETITFPIYTGDSTDGFKYPFSYPFNYIALLGATRIDNDHYAKTNAIITFYGAATNPQIAIDSHIYLVNGTLGDFERYEINQKERTVYKITQSGERINAFASRGKEYSVFEPIPAGATTVFYNGDYAVDIKLLKERSEPIWN